jgi:tetrahydromethanopterin S-methyltransferase subunit C
VESATGSHPASLAPDRTRPALALVLALLSLPGSTVAWYLIPLGGLLIGLPLAVGAVVIGARARREVAGGPSSGIATAAIAIGTLALAQMIVYYLVESLA